MENQNEILKELKEQAPFVSGIKKKNPFRIPENYFNTLPDRVLTRLYRQEAPVSLLEKLQRNLGSWVEVLFRPQFAIPGTVVAVMLVMALYLFLPDRQTSNNKVAGMAQLSDKEIDSYLANNLDDYDLSAFNSQSELPGDDLNMNEIGTEELNNYIVTNVDEQTLEEEFL